MGGAGRRTGARLNGTPPTPDPPLPPHLAAGFAQALRRVQDTPGVLGVLWCGSAARGEADRHSDLDFLALVSGETRWRESFAALGTPAEAFYNPAAQLRHDVRDGDASTLFMLAEGRVMTPHPVLSELQTAARERLRAGRSPEPATPFIRHVLVDAVWEARATQDTPLHALVALDTTRRLVRALYAQRGWWDTKPRQWLPDLSYGFELNL